MINPRLTTLKQPLELIASMDSSPIRLVRVPLEQVLDTAAERGMETVEIATGNWSGSPHANLQELVNSATARNVLAESISSRGLTLSALTQMATNSTP
jgi:sugar phosphate isomerase/epimerase